MAKSTSPTTPSWWQTLPGVLTGVAALLTAVTGLLVAFNHTSRNEPVQPASTASTAEPRRPSSETRASVGEGASGAPTPIALPSLSRVKFASGAAVVTILSAEVEPIDLDRRSLKFRVRHLNTGSRQENFWGNSYQLLVDDVPRATTNFLDELVDANGAKDADVVFEVPTGVKDVVLQISSGDEKSRFPFKLP